MHKIIEMVGIAASVTLPLFNIPLLMHIVKRKSSKDISLHWAVGVWSCLLFMLPAGLISDDLVLKIFSISNFVLFSGVMGTVLAYRPKEPS